MKSTTMAAAPAPAFSSSSSSPAFRKLAFCHSPASSSTSRPPISNSCSGCLLPSSSHKKGLQESKPQQLLGEEKIVVTVRLRPLSKRELDRGDICAWDVPDSNNLLFKPPSLPDRSPAQQKSYCYDRVFGPDSGTDRVYQEGARDVALSALNGVNATIFAYGQTSSGKTYTMTGIIENAIADIYAHVEKHDHREFLVKVAALEIYNELVKDVLHPESGPLRLMDDPEKGIVVDRLTEITVKDIDHLRQILAICQAQRHVGETTLNDTSSRSHQVIRLTVESFPRGISDEGLVNSLVASLNFVDLAGSERASQTMAEGVRLKEGSHINRSLLTLSSIIRKLSDNGRTKNGHLPYRDSKLTRILQNSLGGNARTAIICTMSPALSQVEQSRNTLSFATRAKEVTNSAHVNMVISHKALVKQLQKEVARLQSELKVPESPTTGSSETDAILHEKDAKIQKMELEMKELMRQRDNAQARLNKLLEKAQEDEQSKEQESSSPCRVGMLNGSPCEQPVTPCTTSENCNREGGGNSIKDDQQQNVPKRKNSLGTKSMKPPTTATFMLVQEIKKLEHLQDELGDDATRALEALQKEVECLRLAQAGMNKDAAATIAKLQGEIRNSVHLPRKRNHELPAAKASYDYDEEERSRMQEGRNRGTQEAIASLEDQLECVQKSIDNMVLSSDNSPDAESPARTRTPRRASPLMASSRDNRHHEAVSSPRTRRTLFSNDNENHPPPNGRDLASPITLTRAQKSNLGRRVEEAGISCAEGTAVSGKSNTSSSSVDIKKMQRMFKTAAEENIRSIRSYVTELKERVAKLQYQKQLLLCQVLELESSGDAEGEEGAQEQHQDSFQDPLASPCCSCHHTPSSTSWKSLFETQRQQIIELWDSCDVSIVHRTQFYLLFRGDPEDAIYMEVELRRLKWLKEQLEVADMGNETVNGEDERANSNMETRKLALKREREVLAKRMRSCFKAEEREELFLRWGIPLASKHRKWQLAQLLWHNTRSVEESAAIVGRLVGFWEPQHDSLGNYSSRKEMFQLSFSAPITHPTPWLSSGWSSIATILNL